MPQKMVILKFMDAPELWQFGLQDAASPVMEEVIFFHDQILFILTLILTSVFWMLARGLTLGFSHRHLTDGTLVEVV